jgi:ABC-type transporter Mla subunit MlaD
MAGDVTTSVTAVISVVDKATPAIDAITKSLGQVEDVAKQVGTATAGNLDAIIARVEAGTRTLSEIQADSARSIEEQRRQFEAAGILKVPPWAKVRAPELPAPELPEVPELPAPELPEPPDLAPAVEQQVEQITAAAEQLDEPLTSMGERLRESLSRTFSDLGERAGALGARIKQRIGGAFSGLVGLFEGVAGRLKGIFTGLSGFLAGAGFAEAIRIVTAGLDAFAETAQRLGEQARSLGIPVERLQELQRWARDANLPLKQLDTNLARLTRTIGEVAAGENKQATALFKELSIAVTDAAGKARPTADVLRDIASAIARMPNAADRAAAGFALFGRNWEGMIDALRAGPEAIDAAAKAQQDLGVITEQQVQQVAEYQKALRGVGEQWRGIGADFRASLGELLLPVVTPVLQQLEKWLQVNREWLKLGLKGAVSGLASAFQELGGYIKSTGDDLKAFAGLVEPVTTALDEIRKALQLPEISIPTDPITAFREGIITALQAVEGFLASIATKLDDVLGTLGEKIAGIATRIKAALDTPLADVWLGTLEKIKTVWEAIARAIETVAGAWERFRGIKPEQWVAGAVPTVPPLIAKPPEAVSVGGGPLTWETLGGQQPGGLIGAAGQPANGRVDVVIENKNAPPGTRTTAKATGPGVTTDVGQSMPWTAPAYGAGPWAPAGA